MGDVSKRHHKKLTAEERDQIALMRGRGESIRSIAVFLGRSPGTISDELRRNGLPNGDYVAIHAQAETEARKRKARKRHPLKSKKVYAYVIENLREGWSPEQIAGRLKLEQGQPVICHETIYRYIYSEEGKKKGLMDPRTTVTINWANWAWRPTLLTRTHRGSEARTSTTMVCCDVTYPREPRSLTWTQRISTT